MSPHRSRLRLIGCLVALMLFILGVMAARADARECDERCAERVAKREAHQKWYRAVRAYGIGLLRARMRCESGNHGGYRLDTTGNSYWFAHQMNVQAWLGAGGRVRNGRPVGVWSTQPERLEQDYRTVRWAAIHGGDAWPNCP
jgi:hypothetical protein